jgi:hypothetical protein
VLRKSRLRGTMRHERHRAAALSSARLATDCRAVCRADWRR